MKHLQKLYGVSLALISVTTLITTVTGLIGIPLPLWAMRAIGIVGLISLPVLIYSSIRSMKEKAELAAKAAGKTSGKHVPVKAVALRKSGSAAGEAGTPASPEAAGAAGSAKKVRPKPHPQQRAAKRAAAGNRPKKGKKKK